MDHKIRKMRQLSRGFEAEVMLGVEGPPGSSVSVMVVLSPIDPEWIKVRQSLEKLLATRAESALSTVVERALMSRVDHRAERPLAEKAVAKEGRRS